MTLLLEQVLNGLQYGVTLFLLAAGLTLVFGIMGLINLAHGSLYMIGAFVAARTQAATGSFLLAVPAGMVAVQVPSLAFASSFVPASFMARVASALNMTR